MDDKNGINIEIKKQHSGYEKCYETITLKIFKTEDKVLSNITINGENIKLAIENGCATGTFRLAH